MLSFVNHRLWWLRAKTLGVRAVVLDETNVLLVRHTYLEGWYLPGGAVDAGETAEAAVIRELREETGVLCAERPALHGFFRNHAYSRRDHVVCYVIRRFTTKLRPPDWEIAETGFFPVDKLPEGTSPASRARIFEVMGGKPAPLDW